MLRLAIQFLSGEHLNQTAAALLAFPRSVSLEQITCPPETVKRIMWFIEMGVGTNLSEKL
jgi:hypothetical protein